MFPKLCDNRRKLAMRILLELSAWVQDRNVTGMRKCSGSRGCRGIWLYFFRYNRLQCDSPPASLNRTLLIAVPGGAASGRIGEGEECD